MQKLGFSSEPFGLSNNLFDTVKEKINKGKEDLNKYSDDITTKGEEIFNGDFPDIQKVENGENEGVMTKVKRKFNETTPAVVGGGALLISKFALKFGWVTSGVIGALSYLGKTHLDKSGGLSDSFEWSIMSESGKTPDGQQLYLNTKNAKLYLIAGTDQNGLPIFKQYYN